MPDQNVSIYWTEFTGFFKTHERLIIVVLVLALMLFGTVKYFDHVAAEDKLKSSATTQTLAQQVAANQTLADATKQALAQNQALVTQLAAQNQTLANSIAARNQQTTVQQTKDATLPPDQLADRWQYLTPGAVSGDITPTTGGYTVKSEAAPYIVQQLEEVPTLQQNLEDVQTQSSNKDKEINSDATVIKSQTDQITGLQKQTVDQTVACKAEVASVKATERKHAIWWAIGSFIGGVILGRR